MCVCEKQDSPGMRLLPRIAKVKAAGTSASSSTTAHAKTKSIPTSRRRQVGHFFLFFDAKVGFENLDALVVNVIVGVLLQVFNLAETFSFADKDGHLIRCASLLGFFLPDLENVFDAFESNGNNLGVDDRQEVAKRTDASLLHQEFDLLRISTGCGVGNGPGSFLANIEFGIAKKLNQRRNNVVLDDALNLLLVSGGDVRDGPTGFLANALFRAGEECEQARQGIVVDDKLCLQVIARDNVSDRTESGRLNRGAASYIKVMS